MWGAHLLSGVWGSDGVGVVVGVGVLQFNAGRAGGWSCAEVPTYGGTP